MTGLSVSLTSRMRGFTLNARWEIGCELTALLGFSGAGKSLTLRMIAGLLTPDSGRIACNDEVFFDSDSKIDKRPQERSLGYLFQNLALFPHMTVQENILYGGHGLSEEVRRQRANDLISSFGLRGLEKRRPSEISGGQQQRVAFARALLRRPRTLLLDEPFSALDAPLRRNMCMLLKDVQHEYRVPVVLVTHDRREALSICDRVIVYDGGRVTQSGAPEDLLRRPASEVVVSLLQEDAPKLHAIELCKFSEHVME